MRGFEQHDNLIPIGGGSLAWRDAQA
jgi:hypothetical protein